MYLAIFGVRYAAAHVVRPRGTALTIGITAEESETYIYSILIYLYTEYIYSILTFLNNGLLTLIDHRHHRERERDLRGRSILTFLNNGLLTLTTLTYSHLLT